MLLPPAVVHAMLRGYFEVNEGRLNRFSLILVVSSADYENIIESDEDAVLAKRLNDLVVFATIDDENVLTVIGSFNAVRTG